MAVREYAAEPPPQISGRGGSARANLRPLRGFLWRGLLEQSVAERLAWAAFVAGLLWLAIWWALS
jgi:hypothetical protein